MQRPKLSITRIALGAAIALGVGFSAAAAQTEPAVPINKEKHINSSLLSAAIGSLIEKNCSTMSPRMMLAIWKAKQLYSYALDQGYTDAEVRAFVNNKDEQQRMRRAANRYLRKNGVVKGDEATYCAVGRMEIEKGTLTGQLLRGS